ncbi:tRNA uridine-5-carboxymethylaminomethyl(34) synthesis enzyme MnmG, partial [Candidatus Auribacterota bacterium]
MKTVLEKQQGLDLKQDMAEEIIVHKGKVTGVRTQTGSEYRAKAVIITAGTFMKGLVHIGMRSFSSGRAGEVSSERLSDSLREIGFDLGRLKTGTPPRINKNSIDYSKTDIQNGEEPLPFSMFTVSISLPQVPCHITYTTKKTKEIIQKNLDMSPLYSGVITGIGPRYCPSIEDKIVKFSDRDKHQVFLEPEGLNTDEIYINGCSTSMPEDIQYKIIRSITGLEEANIMRPAYAIEYDYANPTQLHPTLETKPVKDLFFAGQINGTSGYEEAAAQGLIAGINAVLSIEKKDPLILDRSEAYIGVLIDDLVTKGAKEPYRMFTSRAEYRLLLRQDNADMRLMEYGNRYGLIDNDIYRRLSIKKECIAMSLSSKKGSLPSVVKDLCEHNGTGCADDDKEKFFEEVWSQVQIEKKYEGYIKRQEDQIAKFKRQENKKIPSNFDYSAIKGLKKESMEKLISVKPVSIGQASRISGITPADISILLVWLERGNRTKDAQNQEATVRQ